MILNASATRSFCRAAAYIKEVCWLPCRFMISIVLHSKPAPLTIQPTCCHQVLRRVVQFPLSCVRFRARLLLWRIVHLLEAYWRYIAFESMLILSCLDKRRLPSFVITSGLISSRARSYWANISPRPMKILTNRLIPWSPAKPSLNASSRVLVSLRAN